MAVTVTETGQKEDLRPGKVLHDLFTEVFALHAALSSVMDSVHEQAGLRTPQLRIMRLLERSGPVTVPDAAARLGVSRQFVQVVCNELLARGYLQFADNPRHKRSRLAVVTEAGRQAYARAREKENEIIEGALPDIEPHRAAETRGLLARVRQVLEKRLAGPSD